MTLAIAGKPVTTTATEFRLLDCLARHPGRVFTRDQLLDAVWRDTQFVTPARSMFTYAACVKRLTPIRKILDTCAPCGAKATVSKRSGPKHLRCLSAAQADPGWRLIPAPA